jgi:hypothetical protein
LCRKNGWMYIKRQNGRRGRRVCKTFFLIFICSLSLTRSHRLPMMICRIMLRDWWCCSRTFSASVLELKSVAECLCALKFSQMWMLPLRRTGDARFGVDKSSARRHVNTFVGCRDTRSQACRTSSAFFDCRHCGFISSKNKSDNSKHWLNCTRATTSVWLITPSQGKNCRKQARSMSSLVC